MRPHWSVSIMCAAMSVHGVGLGAGKPSDAPGAQSAQDAAAQTPRFEAHLLPERQTVEPGDSVRVAVRLRMREGWHVYWRNCGDAGAPLEPRLSGPESVRIGALRWPAPERHIQTGILTYVYEEQTTLVTTVSVAPDAHAGAVTIRARFDVFICDADRCLFEQAAAECALTIGPASSPHDPAVTALLEAAEPALPRPLLGEAAEAIDTQWRDGTLTVHAQGAQELWYYPLAPEIPSPVDAIADGHTQGPELRFRYTPRAAKAELHGVLRVRGGLGEGVHEVRLPAAAPPPDGP